MFYFLLDWYSGVVSTTIAPKRRTERADVLEAQCKEYWLFRSRSREKNSTEAGARSS